MNSEAIGPQFITRHDTDSAIFQSCFPARWRHTADWHNYSEIFSLPRRPPDSRVLPNTHRRREATVELSRVGVGATSSRRLPTGAFIAPIRRNSARRAVGKFVQTRRDYRQLVANSVRAADATQLDSCVASAVSIGFMEATSYAVAYVRRLYLICYTDAD